MDRTVIIDGVNVAVCKFYEKKAVLYDCIEGTSGDDECYKCKDEPNCYYKQLQRAKEENEKLKEELRQEKIYSSQVEELEESIHHYIAENEKLKQQLKQQQYKRELDYGQGYKAYATEKGVFADVDI